MPSSASSRQAVMPAKPWPQTTTSQSISCAKSETSSGATRHDWLGRRAARAGSRCARSASAQRRRSRAAGAHDAEALQEIPTSQFGHCDSLPSFLCAADPSDSSDLCGRAPSVSAGDGHASADETSSAGPQVRMPASLRGLRIRRPACCRTAGSHAHRFACHRSACPYGADKRLSVACRCVGIACRFIDVAGNARRLLAACTSRKLCI